MNKLFIQFSFFRLLPVVSIVFIFTGPYFLFQSLSFLHQGDYPSAILALAAGWILIRAGIDITKAYLASFSKREGMSKEKEHPS